jgi:L-serine dehydratase
MLDSRLMCDRLREISMKSIRNLYKIGIGPSSSHSMGPQRAAECFLDRLPADPARITVELHGSLAATGRGHLTDQALIDTLDPLPVEIRWHDDELPGHPNAMVFIGFDEAGDELGRWRVYSVGGGNLCDEDGHIDLMDNGINYPARTFLECVEWAQTTGRPIWEYVDEYDGADIWTHLENVWEAMKQSIRVGLAPANPVLPGPLKLPRRAAAMLASANDRVGSIRDRNLLSAYALAVAEENAGGGVIVTAPTCGACGVLPSVLHFFWKHLNLTDKEIVRALVVAGLIGQDVAERASISGAEVGCQGEIGTACAMAAGAAVALQHGSPQHIEYAAEMGLEHFLGLTCDPILGLVQIPCIERNAFAAMRAMDCAAYALATDGTHYVSFEDVVEVMAATGKDLQCKYRETARGGLAERMRHILGLDSK